MRDNSAYMKASSEIIYSKSTISDFLLKVCRGREIFSRTEVDNRHFPHCILIVDLTAEERSAISM